MTDRPRFIEGARAKADGLPREAPSDVPTEDEAMDWYEGYDSSQTTIPITKNNLPVGNFWEADLACWQYERDAHYERGYRMKPMNIRAFSKGEPTGSMTDFYPVIGGIDA